MGRFVVLGECSRMSPAEDMITKTTSVQGLGRGGCRRALVAWATGEVAEEIGFAELWRVQAFWTVGGERRSYEPVFCEGREAADRAAEEIAATLRHFPTLEVVVAPATADEVEAQRVESERQAAKPPEPIHLMDEVRPGATACGATGNAIALDLWHLSGGPKCPTCNSIAASSLR